MRHVAALFAAVAAIAGVVTLTLPVAGDTPSPTPAAPVAKAPPPIDLTPLRTAERFALGGVGFAGAISPGEAALNRLAETAPRDALAAALRALALDAAAPPQARLYALHGLRRLNDPAAAREAAAALATDKRPVPVASGCVFSIGVTSEEAARLPRTAITPVIAPTPPPMSPDRGA